MENSNLQQEMMNVFVIEDAEGNAVLNAPLFVYRDVSIEDLKKSLVDYFSRYTDYKFLTCCHVSCYNSKFFYFDDKKNFDLSFDFEMDESIREAERNLIREKVKYETYRDNAVVFFEKYSSKEKKKKCRKKK